MCRMRHDGVPPYGLCTLAQGVGAPVLPHRRAPLPSVDAGLIMSEPQSICEVGWHLRRPVTREAYRRDLAYASEMALDVHEWRGQDREGAPIIVAWVVTPNGSLLSAYELTQGA